MKTTSFLFCLVLVVAPITGVIAADAEATGTTKTLVWPDGTRYVGGVIEGKRSGKGTIFWQDGTRFVGQFQNDMRNGPGTMILPDGTVYTGFFKNDELIDTESTIAASNANASDAVVDIAGANKDKEMDDSTTSAALGETKLPMEADSLAIPEENAAAAAEIAQVDENDLIEPEQVATRSTSTTATNSDEPGIADLGPSETMQTESLAAESNPFDTEVTEVNESVKADLVETIDLWVAAWEDQNVVQYLENYASEFAVPGRQSRRTWEALRRTRLARPKYINVDVVYQRFEFVETNVVDVFLRQTYRSDSYSDLTDKVLRMTREDNSWKILAERSR